MHFITQAVLAEDLKKEPTGLAGGSSYAPVRLCYQQRPNRRIANLASAFLLLAARKRAVRVGKAKLRTQFILHYGKKSWLYHKTVTVFSLEVPKE